MHLSYLIFFFTLTFTKLQAQQCNGSLGDPIVNFTFGAGNNPGASLSAATTAYQFVPNDCPNDGFYTVRNNTTSCFNNAWHTLTSDHTGDTNGFFMLVNASLQPSAFYVDTVKGLCSNSTYEFAAWIMNVSILSTTTCGGNSIQPNITFTIEKTDGTILQTNTTNNIPLTSNAIWKKYNLIFNTPVGVTDVVLKMKNNATGGCGNDLALDDITFRACGPVITTSINGNLNTTGDAHCEGTFKNYNFICDVSAGLNNPSYQWQQLVNNIFVDIVGENSLSLNKIFDVNAPAGFYKYRLNVAETGNINSSICRTLSKEILITRNKKPTTAASNNDGCQNKSLLLKASITETGNTFIWTGVNNFTSFFADANIPNIQLSQAGMYFVMVKNLFGCTNTDSTLVIVNTSPIATTNFTDSTICEGKQIKLIANAGIKYQWMPTTFLDSASSPSPICIPINDIKYKVVVSNIFNCSDTAFTSITVTKKLIIDAGKDIVTIANKPIILKGAIFGNALNYSWSPNEFINNVTTLNPTINPPTNKIYYLTASNVCSTVTDSVFVKIFNGIFIPNTFTPNGDTKNDTWNIPALQAYPMHELKIYNRYGEIVFERKQNFIAWDGKYKGEPMPRGTYIYVINLKNGTEIIKGTLLLSR